MAERRRFGWCLHCERAFEVPGEWPEDWWHIGAMRQPPSCPQDGCDGEWMDLRAWEHQWGCEPGYPSEPVPGRRYGMDGLVGGADG